MKRFLPFFIALVLLGSAKAQIITTIAGNGAAGYNGDGVAGTAASLYSSYQVTTDKNGNVYIADYANHRVRKVDINGIITTVAGNGIGGYSGDGGVATAASMYYPEGVAVDTAGNLFIADNGNSVIRKVTPAGIISTIAGDHSLGFGGDGGPATSAQFYNPGGICLDAVGNLYVADIHNNRVRKITKAGIISTIAGNGPAGYSGDGVQATASSLNYPNGVAVDAAGNVYIADIYNQRIRKVNTSGIISTVVGNGVGGYNGDGIAATTAQLYSPGGVVIDASGNLFVADFSNNRIRKVDVNGIITTIAGTGTAGFAGDGGTAVTAQLNGPLQLALDASGNIYISDRQNNRVRKIINAVPTITSFTPTSAGNGYTVVITGTNLTGATAVSFGGVAAKSFTVNSATKITAVVNTGASGSVSVTTTGGTATLSGFSFCVTPTIKITANATSPVCAGTKITFTATATNGGAAPVYQWLKNGIVVGSNSVTYTDSAIKTGDTVLCKLTSNATPCVTVNNISSNKLSFTVNPLLTPSVSILASPGTEVCAGVKVILTATAVNGGSTPHYVWKKNGIVAGKDTTAYIDTIPKSGDSISVTLTSNAACLTTGPVNSNVVKIKVDAPTPVITITANKDTTICSTNAVTFTATVNPVFLWRKSGVTVGNSSNTYKDSTLKNGDVVQCFLVSATSACNSTSSNIINSNQLKFKVNTAPAQPSAISGPIVFAKLQKGIYYSVIPVAGVTYAWTLPSGAVIDSGQGASKIKVSWGSVGGTVSVIAINSCGSSPARTLTVGVTGFTGSNPGKVVVDNTLKLYPNPATTTATLQFKTDVAGKYAITITDASNNIVDIKTGTSVKGDNVIKLNTSQYAKGVYFISIIDKHNGQRNIEFVKGN